MENLSLRSGRNNGTHEQTSAGMEFPPAAGKNFIIFQKIFCIAVSLKRQTASALSDSGIRLRMIF